MDSNLMKSNMINVYDICRFTREEDFAKIFKNLVRYRSK